MLPGGTICYHFVKWVTTGSHTASCFYWRNPELEITQNVTGGTEYKIFSHSKSLELNTHTHTHTHTNADTPSLTIIIFSPMPPAVLTNFVVFPPVYGDSVADFWGWDAYEGRLRCLIGDMYMKMRYHDGPLSLSLLTTQTMVTMGIFPYPEKFPW